jgi:hypothetical protein
MKRFLFLALCSFAISNISGQSDKHRYIGINVLGLTTTTLSTNYGFDIKPFLSPLIDIGYTFNYENSFDFVGTILTPHCKCGNYGYDLNKQSGAYLKLGTLLNLRKAFEKENYFHIGLFFTNSLSYQKCIYQPPLMFDPFFPLPTPLSHSKYIWGVNASIGYEFSIVKNLKSSFDFQVSFPNKNYKDLYGYRNYIPGMGFKDFDGYWFPMFIWNLKYRL